MYCVFRFYETMNVGRKQMVMISEKFKNGLLIFWSLAAAFLLLQGGASAQTSWEFSGTTYAFQKAHFDSATNVIKSKLGIQMHSFGAPYNQNDTTCLRVISEDTNYKVIMYSQVAVSPTAGYKNLSNRVYIESATGVPDSAYFMNSYNSLKNTYTDYMVMQGHAYAWTTAAKQAEFQKIVNYLISQNVKFTTPYEYYQYLTDSSIPRTNKVQVILKLDDLRANTSYFTPCFQAYDFLVSKKVKAGFGVNNMWNLTQTQIDTLNYYLRQSDTVGTKLFEIWNHGLDHSQTSGTTGGPWSDPASWPSGAVPTAIEDAIIPSGVTITLDSTATPAVCNDLTISGTLVAANTNATSLTVYGDVLINSGGSFTSPALTGGTSNIIHNQYVYGNFTNSGGTFDFRTGSAGTTMRVMNTSFIGTFNSVISVGTFASNNNDFNSITINKTDSTDKIICASDVFCDQGASTCVSQLILTKGIIETGSSAIYALSTTGTDVVGGSSASYVNGALGRGMSNSVGKNNPFPIGDANAYRPISVRSTTGGTATGHYVLVRCIDGNANTGSSAFAGGVDAVSKVRYYQISYNKGLNSGATTMSFSQFSPSYGLDDGVKAGNTELRVVYSTNDRATWNGMSQSTQTTAITYPPTTLTPTALVTALTLNSGTGYIYVSLAKTTNSSNNPLPVELTSLNAASNNANVILTWNTATEVNSASFEVERALVQTSLAGNWKTVASVSAAGNSNSPKAYSFTEKNVTTGNYAYRLKMVDNDGTYTYSNSVEVKITAPGTFMLGQNYPNPFNPTTIISYQLPVQSAVTIKVFNALGSEIATLVQEEKPVGAYEVPFDGSSLSSGVYFYQLRAGNFVETKKFEILK